MPLDEPLELYSVLSSAPSGELPRSPLLRVLEAIEKSPTVSFLLDAERRLVYTNPAWDEFATSNGAPELSGEALVGLQLFDVIPNVLKPVYAAAFDQVQSDGRTWEHLYECSSPDQFRQFR